MIGQETNDLVGAILSSRGTKGALLIKQPTVLCKFALPLLTLYVSIYTHTHIHTHISTGV